MRRRRSQNLASSPTVVGAVTVLVVVLAVFLAYNANNGLPFVPTYDLKAQLPNAEGLVRNNEVRIGGIRVGIVQSVTPEHLSNGRFAAKVSLSLDKNVEPLPADSTLDVRLKSAIGLKYLELIPGHSRQSFSAGSTIPVSAAHPAPVGLDQFFNTFNAKTRAAIKGNLVGFGDALAGRGPALNGAIQELRPLLVHLQPAAANLVSPQTDFGGFWRSLEALAAEVAPVAEQQASMFVGLDVTFGAFARIARPFLEQTIAKGPAALSAANRDLPAIDPFLRDSQRFFTALQPGAKALAQTSPEIAAALRAGVPVLRRSPILDAQLPPTAQALLDFQNAPGVVPGLDLLIDTNNILDPSLKLITPAQSSCNYLTLLFENASSMVSAGDGLGTWQRFIAFTPPSGTNNEGSPASGVANGPETPNHLHYNPYPNTASPGQTKECEAGNEKYLAGQTLVGNVPGNAGTITHGQLAPKKGSGK